MYDTDEMFPTLFSGAVAESVGLINEKGALGENEERFEQIKRLGEFQNMVLGGCTTKQAMIAYHGIELTEEQQDALILIEKSTKPYVLGQIASTLTKKIKRESGRHVVDAAEILLSEMISSEEGGMTSTRARQLIVKLRK